MRAIVRHKRMLSKSNKTFRLDPSLVSLIEHASKLSGLSQADIVARCVLAQVRDVLASVAVQRRALHDPQVATTLANFAKNHPFHVIPPRKPK